METSPVVSPLCEKSLVSRVKIIPNLLPEEKAFLMRVCEEIEKSSVDRELPVLYAGSGGDVEHAVILGDNLVFVDSHLPEVTLMEIRHGIDRIGGEIVEERREGVLGKGGRHVINFRLNGCDINLTYYAEDATKIGDEFMPEELKDGCSVYFVKVPLPKEERVGSLVSPEVLARMLDFVVNGGFYLERECPITRFLSPELAGFEKVASGFISALSINYDEEGNLYRKVRDVENLAELLRVDRELYRLCGSRHNSGLDVNDELSKHEVIRLAREHCERFPDKLKDEVIKAVKTFVEKL
ncbi:hypothetical protein [Archaeoglobus veneficus]|uniref:Uncharacterized protein n=1 Tax=Archaeoglobus veneficus (strain DSM 11195 / SNP6) TaxID=693661 RepID=F2KS44_ARCVS|nr:hypothetical protein [Archaeoglobus veneficus]AEA47983.1 hypothetical protein Arcve_1990 [Archaeoglobus veneficus SNP6]